MSSAPSLLFEHAAQGSGYAGAWVGGLPSFELANGHLRDADVAADFTLGEALGFEFFNNVAAIHARHYIT